MKNLVIVVGTRPNFIKITQFKKVAERDFPGTFKITIVHTGQHYDDKMANVFFQQFELEIDYFLDIPAVSPNTQMAEVMLRLEPVIKECDTDMLLVTGDVNSTFAAALTANKMDIPLGHIESGLRSRDRSMPEEINRILTDEISDYLFITEQSGIDNLRDEGKPEKQLFFVGNTMIDTMVAFEDKIESSPVMEKLGLENGSFVLMTMHRPATVDHEVELIKLIQLIEGIASTDKLVFPIHPRTVHNLKKFNLHNQLEGNKNVLLTDPLDYFAFQKLIARCKYILTDSGGIQEESTFRRVPCLTLRPNTERPSTVELGTNTLVPFELDIIRGYISDIEKGDYKLGNIPPKWDGHTTYRILEILKHQLAAKSLSGCSNTTPKPQKV
ncbi:non-hydrolyzing UDP-N-acetylglucosamine 2-epimerase [Fodinibius saliphilus]|uniref:non-hydrolyzing UDP-N-acetylglucosamine 2-epimerase n=1 Tax=Fodinibius saliphilus TaxID=1920650 RepID=UPI001107B087|nr:UDP-N-acetylglucosamine 2-epimerase (non-hydrolyzing) [Fodinibius saliphilus]